GDDPAAVPDDAGGGALLLPPQRDDRAPLLPVRQADLPALWRAHPGRSALPGLRRRAGPADVPHRTRCPRPGRGRGAGGGAATRPAVGPRAELAVLLLAGDRLRGGGGHGPDRQGQAWPRPPTPGDGHHPARPGDRPGRARPAAGRDPRRPQRARLGHLHPWHRRGVRVPRLGRPGAPARADPGPGLRRPGARDRLDPLPV
ncbi:MAG: hypothetical protein AVDCRST_MAG49-3596, partial [uncultured Thermomicrobiales bacterium]